MMDMQKNVTLLKNLSNRMDYNRDQHTYKLAGTITLDEKEALDAATNFYSLHANRMEKEKATA